MYLEEMASVHCPYGPLVSVGKHANESRPHTIKASSEGRADGRTAWDEMRTIFLRGGVLSTAAGSAYWEAGATKIFCAVHGPRASASPVPITGSLVCEIRWARFAGSERADRTNVNGGGTGIAIGRSEVTASEAHATDQERELGATLSRVLSAGVRLESYPKSKIEVVVFVLEDGGGALAGAVTAASLALADAGIEMYDLMSGCNAASINGKVVLDPCSEEESRADSTVFVACMPSLGRITNIIQTGEMELVTLAEAVKVCSDGAYQVTEFVRSSLMKQTSKQMRNRERKSY
jgi:exosome complex component MTR3